MNQIHRFGREAVLIAREKVAQNDLTYRFVEPPDPAEMVKFQPESFPTRFSTCQSWTAGELLANDHAALEASASQAGHKARLAEEKVKRLETRITRLEAEIESEGWQPIETAPFTGEKGPPIDLWCAKGYRETDCHWDGDRWVYLDTHGYLNEWAEVVDPTHWRNTEPPALSPAPASETR